MPKPKYTDCDNALFVSYAHRDDVSNDRWVTVLQDAIRDRLVGLPGEIPQLKIHFSGKGDHVTGDLGFELQDALKRSFAMLIVVGKKYVESDWCERELEFFQQLFDEDGHRGRLYIAVMNEKSLDSVRKKAGWSEIIDQDKLWVPFFEQGEAEKPLEHRLLEGPGLPAPFRNKVWKITDRLMQEIESDYSKSQSDAMATGKQIRTPWSPTAAEPLRVAIGPHQSTLKDAVAQLRSAVAETNAQITDIGSDALLNYDKDDEGNELRRQLKSHDVLVVPLADEKPLFPMVDGGHAGMLWREWEALGKDRSIIRYQPELAVTGQVLEDPGKLAPHLPFFKELKIVCRTPQAVVNLLFGPNRTDYVNVYIQRRVEYPTHIKLSECLFEAWKSVRENIVLPATVSLPDLACEAVHLADLPDVAQDASAFVLVRVDKETADKSLLSQEAEVRKLMPRRGVPRYPGLVAAIFFKPELGEVRTRTFDPVKFYLDPDTGLSLDPGSKALLDEFLGYVSRRWLDQQQPSSLQRPV